MKRLFFASALLLGACSANAEPQTFAPALSVVAESSGDLQCHIDAARTEHGVRFEAGAWSGEDAAGAYEFVITRHDRGGSSDIAQSGDYVLAPGAPQTLGSAEISIERGGSYEARLILTNAEGVACSAEQSR